MLNLCTVHQDLCPNLCFKTLFSVRTYSMWVQSGSRATELAATGFLGTYIKDSTFGFKHLGALCIVTTPWNVSTLWRGVRWEPFASLWTPSPLRRFHRKPHGCQSKTSPGSKKVCTVDHAIPSPSPSRRMTRENSTVCGPLLLRQRKDRPYTTTITTPPFGTSTPSLLLSSSFYNPRLPSLLLAPGCLWQVFLVKLLYLPSLFPSTLALSPGWALWATVSVLATWHTHRWVSQHLLMNSFKNYGRNV